MRRARIGKRRDASSAGKDIAIAGPAKAVYFARRPRRNTDELIVLLFSPAAGESLILP